MYFEDNSGVRLTPPPARNLIQIQALETSQSLMKSPGVNGSKLTTTLRIFKLEMAEAAIEAFYRRHSVWRTLFGEGAAREAREQLALHVEMLAAAIDLGSPEAFAGYARWLVRVMQARGIAAPLVSEHFDDLETDLRIRLSPLEQRIIHKFMAAANAAVNSPVTADSSPGDVRGVLIQERNRFLLAILEGRREAAVRIARQVVRAGHPAGSIYLELFQGALYEVGRLWEANRIAIAQEHLAVGVVQYAMAHVHALVSPRGRHRHSRRGRAILSGVEGERHQLGAQMVADLLENDGWDVWFLGTDVPVGGIIEAVELRQPDVLGLSASMLWSLPRVKDVMRAVHDALGSAAPRIVVGGAAVRALPDRAMDWGADAVALDASDALHCFARFQPRPSTESSGFRWPWARAR